MRTRKEAEEMIAETIALYGEELNIWTEEDKELATLALMKPKPAPSKAMTEKETARLLKSFGITCLAQEELDKAESAAIRLKEQYSYNSCKDRESMTFWRSLQHSRAAAV